jgi:hypothetical protein
VYILVCSDSDEKQEETDSCRKRAGRSWMVKAEADPIESRGSN